MTRRSQRRHTDYRWTQLKRKFRAACRSSNALCHICVARGDIEHAHIDYNAKPQSPNAFEPDHIKSWKDHPHLRYLWTNLAASHSRCNRQRRDEPVEAYAASGDQWIKPDW